MSDAFDAAQLAVLERCIDEWLADLRLENDAIVAVDRAPTAEVTDGVARWYVRMRGEEKEFTTIWLTLGQRTLRYETYVMPAPQEHVALVYEQALRRNGRMVGAHFSIGSEDALFLQGELFVGSVTAAEIDRIVGSLYAYVEAAFPALIRLGYASHFAD